MPTAVETQSSTAPPKTRRRSRSSTDKRRGRSRSPGAYLKKKGKSLKGFFKGTSSRRLETNKKTTFSKSTPPKAAPTATEPPAVITTKTEKKEDPVVEIEIDAAVSEGLKTSSSDTDAQVENSEKKDAASAPADSAGDTASKTSDVDPQDPEQTPGLKTEEKIISNTVQIILLLMDPTSRRFELLQLEFDSVKAIVQDLLSQIPSSATEESVRDQKYDGICTIGGVEVTCTNKLKDFVEENEGVNSVVLAMPEGVSPEDCAKMAKPILADKNVASMVDPSGKMQLLDIVNETAENPAEQSSKVDVQFDPAEEPDKETTEGPSAEEKKSSPLDTVYSGLATAREQILNIVGPAREQILGFMKNLSYRLAPVRQQILDIMKSVKEGNAPVPLLIVLGVSMFFIPALAFVLYRRHSNISAPFSKGDIITPGVTRSHCGLFGKVPFVNLCEPKSVSFDEDGVLSLYHGDELQWQMKGGKCDNSGEVECTVEISEDGYVMIAGKKARMEGHIAYGISPWPFADQVSVKSKMEIHLDGML